METALWIPCYNEGTQDLLLAKEHNLGPMPEDGHLLHRSLELLKKKIQSGIFGKIIITNDGSDDDTLEGLEKFIQENGLPESRFHVLGESGKVHNQGKMRRFFEVINIAKRLGIENLVMTDADMVDIGSDTFDKLAQPGFTPMKVSHQGEWLGYDYSIMGSRTSGTRSVNIAAIREIFRKNGIQKKYLNKGCGFGLEFLLNYTLPYCMIQREFDEINTPLFLRPLRKSAHKQGSEISKTQGILRDILQGKGPFCDKMLPGWKGFQI